MKTILIAEDDPFMADVYAKSFAKENFKVDIANDGQMTLDKIKNHYPDLLILDIDLPKINGCQVLKMLRENKATKNLKILVLSNYSINDISKKYGMDINNFDVVKFFLKIETAVDEIVKTVKEILK